MVAEIHDLLGQACIAPDDPESFASAVGIGVPYARSLIRQNDKLSASVKSKLQELIAAKATGPAQHESRRYRSTGCVVRCEEVTYVEVATFTSPVAASEYADWLNERLKENDRA